MKRLKTGVVNTLSFVKLSSFTVNSFDVTLEKVVGSGSLTITNLTDLNNLDSCKDFIRINIDLISNILEGGEYELSITNGDSTYTYLTNVESYNIEQEGAGIYASTVKFVDRPIPPVVPPVYKQSLRDRMDVCEGESCLDAALLELRNTTIA